MNLSMGCSWWSYHLRDSGRSFSRSNWSLRFCFSDDVVYESASSMEHWALGFGNFWWRICFFKIFLLSHTHFTQQKGKIKRRKKTPMQLLNASARGRRWYKHLTYFLCRFLPFIFNTSNSRGTIYATFDILPSSDAKMLGSKDVLKPTLI